jgi:hypothetical protein
MTKESAFIRSAAEECVKPRDGESKSNLINRRYQARKKLANAVQDRMWAYGAPICPQARALLAKYDVLVMGD